MGMVKQHLLEQAEKDRLNNSIWDIAHYHGLSVEDMKMDLELVASQKGITFEQAVDYELHDIELVRDYERALEEVDGEKPLVLELPTK